MLSSSRLGKTILSASRVMLSGGNSSAWKALNLFRERFSFFKDFILERAMNNLLGYTNTESLLKLLLDKLISSKHLKNPRSCGNVQKSLLAIFRTASFYR